MTRDDFLTGIEREKVRQDSFDLDGCDRSECYTLSRSGVGWSVYYFERGLRSGERFFASDSEAYEHLFSLLKNDPATKVA